MPNLLSKENSPYLLQHANNPIEWYPWGDKALKKAKEEDKLIFLSIGYSTCFWCHKMAEEAFSDKDVAKYLNENFISIKVDKEERPDIDAVYMEAALSLTENVGWPLNLFLTPDQKPFFAGTYFPVEKNVEIIDFLSLLRLINDNWKQNREMIEKSADELVNNLNIVNTNKEEITSETVKNANLILKSIFDTENGGFGIAPKFPIAHQIFFLLRYWYVYKEEYTLHMVQKTLDKILESELYDKKEGGFYRYATKKDWSSPHYEKMLYTNALMIMAYLEGYLATKKESYKEAIEKSINYLKEKFLSNKGGFFSAEDSEEKRDKKEIFIDKKISAGINGLCIATLSACGKHLGNAEYIKMAENTVEFIFKDLYNNSLKYYEIDDKILHDAYSFDYACLVWGLIELYEATYDINYLKKAKLLNDELIDKFWDTENSGVFLYSKEAKQLITNLKEMHDGATPSTNSMCVNNFLKLGRLTKEHKLISMADELLKVYGEQINKSPADYLYFLCGYLYSVTPKEIIISKDKEGVLDRINGQFRPFTLEMMSNL